MLCRLIFCFLASDLELRVTALEVATNQLLDDVTSLQSTDQDIHSRLEVLEAAIIGNNTLQECFSVESVPPA